MFLRPASSLLQTRKFISTKTFLAKSMQQHGHDHSRSQVILKLTRLPINYLKATFRYLRTFQMFRISQANATIIRLQINQSWWNTCNEYELNNKDKRLWCCGRASSYSPEMFYLEALRFLCHFNQMNVSLDSFNFNNNYKHFNNKWFKQ